MEREPSRSSSNIKSVGYENGIMEVEFRSGSVYQYECSRALFEDWRDNGFGGKYFHSRIRARYEGVKQP